MNACLECEELTQNPKFCSKSCSSKVTNRLRKKILNKCQGCENSVKSTKAIYCSNKCQMRLQTKLIIDEWLANGASIPSAAKAWILKDQQHKCSICSMSDVWNKLSIIFVLDHIDGNSDNNQRSNLRLVCPNCDSQLPTFKSKNKNGGRFYRRQRYAEGKSS